MPQIRDIKTDELELVKGLIALTDKDYLLHSIPKFVFDLDDDGMGSIQFDIDQTKQHYKDLVVVDYIDIDRVSVSIALSIDQDGSLFELDFFKSDFSKLNKYPTINEVILAKDN